MLMFMRVAASLIALLAAALATPAAAQQSTAPGAGAWLPGPGASGDRNTLAGVIDTPGPGATLSGGSLELHGWFVDLTAQGWAGADDVEIFAGAMESGGRQLGHALFAQNRPDVATALKTPYWAASGWSARVSTAGLPTGSTTVSVYVHTPGKGWWLRQVAINLTASTPASASIYGNDISYPQCPSGAEPNAPAFGIVGVNGGKPFTSNPCLVRQFSWAFSATSASQPRVGVYMNTADPGPTSPNWPQAGTNTPRACDGSWSADCAFDYGYLAAQDAYSRVVNVAGPTLAAQVPWWLDVEAANSWSSDLSLNAAALQGALAYLQGQKVAILGIYSTSTDWEALVGQPSAAEPFGGLLNWRPGPHSPQEAQSWCGRTVTGGRVKLVQFPSGGFDTNLACY